MGSQYASGGAYRTFIGPDVDCFSANGSTWTICPPVNGKNIFTPVSINYVIVSKNGTLTTSPIFKAGTNANHDNYSSPLTVTTTTNFNAASVGYYAAFGVTLVASVFKPGTDLSTPLVLEITTQAAGTGSPALVIRPIVTFTTSKVP